MKKQSNEILVHLIETLLISLTELSKIQDTPNEQFAYGEKTAYVECLEIIRFWEHAEFFGLNFEVEERFPL